MGGLFPPQGGNCQQIPVSKWNIPLTSLLPCNSQQLRLCVQSKLHLCVQSAVIKNVIKSEMMFLQNPNER